LYFLSAYILWQCVVFFSALTLLVIALFSVVDPAYPGLTLEKKQVGPNETKKSEYCDVSGVYYMTHFIMLMRCSRLITPVIFFYVYLMYNIDFQFIVFDL